MASGVSSMMRSTPVAFSMARMLRPSLPMTLPFMSSLGRETDERETSETTSEASLWMASEMMVRAFSWASSLARSSASL